MNQSKIYNLIASELNWDFDSALEIGYYNSSYRVKFEWFE